jgi:dTMP kinase
MAEQPGRYVGFEGIDGSGKSMQMQLTKEFAERKGIDVTFLHEPGATNLGVELRNFLLHNKDIQLSALAEFALFSADRIHATDTIIMPALESDQLVVTDRRLESGVYQEAGGGLKLKDMMALSAKFLPERYMNPDALLVFTVSPEVRLQRLQKRFAKFAADKMERRGGPFFVDVEAGYRKLESLPYAHMIDSERDPEDIFKDIKPIIFGKYLPPEKNTTYVV